VLGSMVTISGRATGLSARSGGQVLKQESSPQRRHSGTAWMVLTKLRVNLGLIIATMVEEHHDKAACPVFGRLRAPVVITTTVHANADELQVSTTVEENTGDASTSGCRSGTSHQSIASNVAKPQPAPPPGPPRRGGPEVGTETGLYGDCRSAQCCVAVWSR
jgi:hypothetical protein